jgi:putative ABC transport system permease protein
MLETLRSDLTHALRALRTAPASSALAVAILTAGIAAGTVVFSVVDAVVLRSLPYPEPDRLVSVGWQTARGPASNAAREYLAWRDRAPAFEALAAVHRSAAAVRWDSGEEEGVAVARVSSSLFEVLRVLPALGRAFTQANEIAGSDRVAVIGHGLWTRRFGGDPAAIGRTLSLGGRDVEIVGVMPPGFTYPVALGLDKPTDIWTPYVVPDDERPFAQGRTTYLHVVGRLGPGATADAARVQMETINAALVAEHGRGAPDDWRLTVRPLHEQLVGDVRGWMLLALTAVVLVMIVASVNVANLLLTRAFGRTRDFAVHASLGASRGRLARMALFESLAVSLAAAVLGVIVAYWGIEAIRTALPGGIARASSIALDARVLIAAIGAAVLAAAAAALAPAVHVSRIDLVALLKDGSGAMPAWRRTWRGVLLVAEVAFVFVLLVSTAFVAGSFVAVVRADLGFERRNLVAVEHLSGFSGSLSDIMTEVRGVSGVSGVAAVAASAPPLIAEGFGSGGSGATPLARPESPLGAGPVLVDMYRVSPDYFAVLELAFRRGRTFLDGEPGAVVLDEQAATRLFGDRDPVGHDVRSGGSALRVAGVVASVGNRGPERPRTPQAYFPLPATARGASLVVRTTTRPALVIPAIEAAIARSMPAGRRVQVFAAEDAFSNITAGRRFNAGIMSAFGLLALLIGGAGVYGVMASLVAQRTQEIGVRVALGATAGRIMKSVLGDAARYLTAGVGLGLAAAWPAARTFESLLFGLRATDLSVYAATAAVVLVAGLAAAFVPARRAARVAPMVALRRG